MYLVIDGWIRGLRVNYCVPWLVSCLEEYKAMRVSWRHRRCRMYSVLLLLQGIAIPLIEKSHAQCKAGESERHSVSAWQARLEHSRVKAFAINNIQLSKSLSYFIHTHSFTSHGPQWQQKNGRTSRQH
jgi:hypothetical protein